MIRGEGKIEFDAGIVGKERRCQNYCLVLACLILQLFQIMKAGTMYAKIFGKTTQLRDAMRVLDLIVENNY